MLKRLTISIILLSIVFGAVAQPSTNQIRVDRGELKNITGKKNPELLFDGIISDGNKMDQEGSLNNAYATPMVWELALDSAYEDMKIDYYHGFGASSWTVTFYDSTRTQSRQYSFSGVFFVNGNYAGATRYHIFFNPVYQVQHNRSFQRCAGIVYLW